MFEEYPKETISIEYGHLYANYNECLKHNGDNRYKNPHDGVRKKFSYGERLNKCNLTYDEYLALKHETMSWLTENHKLDII